MVRLIRPGMVRWVGSVALAGAMCTNATLHAEEPAALLPTQTASPRGFTPIADLQSLDAPAAEADIIQERYPSRRIKIERHVIRDAQGDFVNHGSWTMWDEQGRLMSRGECRNGLRHGTWVRHFQTGEAPMLSGAWGKMFRAPYLATGVFVDGELHGAWAIVDAEEHPMCRLEYDRGLRQGKSLWFLPDGQKWREADYRDGELDGRLVEWSSAGEVVADETFANGRRRGIKVEWFSPGVKKTQAEFLFAREITETREDWFAGVSETKIISKEGRDMRDGAWVTWYHNGQKAMEGTFRDDRPDSRFYWWHKSGQRAIEGQYSDGHQSGRWQWWHDSGKKQIVGQYVDGRQIGEWSWWNEDGHMTQSVVYNEQSGGFADEDALENPELPKAPVPMPMPLVPRKVEQAKPVAPPSKPKANKPADDVPQALAPIDATARPILSPIDVPSKLDTPPEPLPAKRPERQAVRPAPRR